MKEQTKYTHLFSPLRIGNVMLMNRIIASPLGAHKIHAPSTTDYGGISIVDRSKGGAAAITLNVLEVAEAGRGKTPFEKYSRDATREILSVVKQAGAMANLEIFFHAMMPRTDGTMMMPCDGLNYKGEPAQAMSQDEIHRAIQNLADTAKAAKDFGFDMITLHFGHDSMTSLFLSPVWNQRTDEYGGSLENRIRITKEAATAVRNAVGKGFPIIARVSRYLYVKETYSEDDMMQLIKTIAEDVDMINVSAGMDEYGGRVDKYEANGYAMTTNFEPHMLNVAFSERVKKETNLLVCPVGAIETPEEAENIIATGKADAVMLGRALVADPYLPKKALENRSDDIVPCLRCLQCYHVATEHFNTVCAVNPRFRRENRVPLRLETAADKKTVVIIGGGPAGCKAALTAAEKGHHVILLEKSDAVGGQISISKYEDSKIDLRRYCQYLQNQIAKSSVEVRTNVDATKEYVEQLKPDALIIAIGADQVVPRIKGIENGIMALSVYPQLDNITGKKIAIIGGGTIGCELAVDLEKHGNTVSIIEMANGLSLRGNALYRLGLMRQLNQCSDLKAYLESAVQEVTKDSVIFKDKAGSETELKVDMTVVAVGMKPKREKAFEYYGITPNTYMIGDCNKVARVTEATNDAYFIASNI